MRKIIFPLAVLGGVFAAGAGTVPLDGGWLYIRDLNGDHLRNIQAADPTEGWRKVEVPHDAAIEGPFNPLAGPVTGKLPWKGAYMYRRWVDDIPAADWALLENGDKAYLEFDGVMADAKGYVNWRLAGGWDYGYMSFRMDVTGLLAAKSNHVVVACSTYNHASRWYPGAGIECGRGCRTDREFRRPCAGESGLQMIFQPAKVKIPHGEVK
ncbi:MAG: hypothetical protein J6T01_04905 [Kiritimatiellae bacterium]|nr:hypothetical protein [Kiritimatiellia bacterium]